MNSVRLAHSTATEAREAVQEFHAAVAQPKMALVIFFCSIHYELDVLAAELRRLFAGVCVIGCTTAGEIGPAGIQDRSLVGASFSSRDFAVEVGRQDELAEFDHGQGRETVQQLLQRLGPKSPVAAPTNCFALMLIDGTTGREETLARVWQQTLGEIPLVGGSAGGGQNFGRRFVYVDGSFRTDCAVCALIATRLPFSVCKTQHFVPTGQRLVITEADPQRREVSEINGLPAAEEYARMLGVSCEDLTPELFASAPVVVMINGETYVRAIQKASADGSLNFLCAIERGVVLRLARGVDMVANLEAAFESISSRIGTPQLTIGFDCMLRRVEMWHKGLDERVGSILTRNHTVGFHTYGEQMCGIHINQTFTCVAIGAAKAETRHE